MIRDKLLERSELIRALEDARQRGERVVFTNGCFDLIHSGHVQYLEEARALGEILVVGVNSDASVMRLKGSSRPILELKERMITLAALESVSYVISFEDDTPYELIKMLAPDILVKGGDWPEDQIVGADIVKAAGGSVKTLSFCQGISTSTIVERIKRG